VPGPNHHPNIVASHRDLCQPDQVCPCPCMCKLSSYQDTKQLSIAIGGIWRTLLDLMSSEGSEPHSTFVNGNRSF